MKGGSNSREGQSPWKTLPNVKHNTVFNTSQKTRGHLRESNSNEITETNQMFASRLEGN